ncbi:hypothetical protein [Shewanella marisflavi]|uniref:Uncharacterized protein n=1 Tax=Shewanella marisflavi TaxID=260364 RepID=A0AAC9XNT7_9GAMM|nr:hypothetical protein [Shewanella marisflavi]ASJ97326.1 hypothetical protein CFF01_12470 [Shewanella marisflavi]
MKNLVVLCPANVTTGGPELLHQFVHEMNLLKVPSKILYYPFEGRAETPQAYKMYNAPQIRLEDCCKESTYLVVPEVATDYLSGIKFKNAAIWWLSVDNYTKKLPKTIKSKLKWLIEKHFLNRAKPLLVNEMQQFTHLTQSFYARKFLEKNGIERSYMLSDYLSSEHFLEVNEVKENIVAFNPKKGVDFTASVISKLNDISFVPIQNMSAKEVSHLLARSKVYIDFGEHPGKDRIPREAAMADAVVITGRKGSADYKEDVYICDEYKFLESQESIDNIGTLIRNVFDNFNEHHSKFEDYRNNIRSEKALFKKQVRDFSKLIFDKC